MKKVFISQPMRGRSKNEIMNARDEAIEYVKEYAGEEIEVIDSYFESPPEGGCSALWYLGKSLQLMSTADIAYFAEGWEKARGCNIEFRCALNYGIKMIVKKNFKEAE